MKTMFLLINQLKIRLVTFSKIKPKSLVKICTVMIFMYFNSYSQNESKADSLVVRSMDTVSGKSQIIDTVMQPKPPVTFKWKVKIVLNNNSSITNSKRKKIYLSEHNLIMPDSTKISISDIKRIRVYRNPMAKTIGGFAIIGMLIGAGVDELEEASSEDGEESYTYFGQGLVAGTAIGIAVSPIALLVTRQNFIIDGKEENFIKMVKLIGPEDWQ